MAGRVHNGLFVEYCAKDFLDATLHMDAWEELAYRRVVDMIYATNDSLRDDDKKLAWSTKAGARWAKIKASLIESGRLEVVDGRITNARCRAELEKTARKIAQKSEAGKASATSRNSLKNNVTTATSVATAPATEQQLTTNPVLTSEADASEATVKTAPLGHDPKPTKPQCQDLDALFSEWWQFVPRKVSKGQAEKAYRAALKHAEPAALLDGIKRFAEQVKSADPQFIAHPATWLNGKRWLDEPAAPEGGLFDQRRSPARETADEAIGRRRSALADAVARRMAPGGAGAGVG